MKYILIISLLMLTGCYAVWQEDQFRDCWKMTGYPTEVIIDNKPGVECWYHGTNGPFMLWQRTYK